jgi:hypothetical protein
MRKMVDLNSGLTFPNIMRRNIVFLNKIKISA